MAAKENCKTDIVLQRNHRDGDGEPQL